jgi:hypothetical protein
MSAIQVKIANGVPKSSTIVLIIHKSVKTIWMVIWCKVLEDFPVVYTLDTSVFETASRADLLEML